MQITQLPHRYYTELLDPELFKAVVNKFETEHSDNSDFISQFHTLLDFVAVRAVMQALETSEERLAFLQRYPASFQDPSLLDSVTQAETLRAMLQEQLERSISSLL